MTSFCPKFQLCCWSLYHYCIILWGLVGLLISSIKMLILMEGVGLRAGGTRKEQGGGGDSAAPATAVFCWQLSLSAPGLLQRPSQGQMSARFPGGQESSPLGGGGMASRHSHTPTPRPAGPLGWEGGRKEKDSPSANQ